MAEKIISPGVFTQENDQSFLPVGVSEIGAAIIGPTVKGPALVPTKISSFAEYVRIFGSYSDDTYIPLVVNEYLKNAGNITVTRLLYEDGYQLSSGLIAVKVQSGSSSYITHVFHPSNPVSTVGDGNPLFEYSTINNDASGSFELKISGSYGFDSNVTRADGFYTIGSSISASILTTDTSTYISRIIPTDSKTDEYPIYTIFENKSASSLFNNIAHVTTSLASASYVNTSDYSTAATPWIQSQKVSGNSKNLFKFHTLSHGTAVNHEVKVGITDIREASEVADPNGYGTFSVVVRRVNTSNLKNSPFDSDDTDKQPDIVETFINVNLDPTSPRYIARVIGDRYRTVNSDGKVLVNGDYNNLSNFIRVEVTDGVKNKTNDKELIPFGFAAPVSPIPNMNGANLAGVSYTTSQVTSGTYNSNTYFGFDFTATPNLAYLSPTPSSGSTTGNNNAFYLGNMTQDTGSAFPSLAAPYSGSLEAALDGDTFATNIAIGTRKFIIPFQGGFDGARPNLPKLSGTKITANNTLGFDCSTGNSTGTTAYNKAINTLANSDVYDINMILTPGILDSLHPSVTSAVRTMVDDRQDVFYIMDTNQLTDPVTTVVSQVNSIDSSYVSSYWPWARVIDPSRNLPIWVPPSVVIPGAIAFNDAVAAPWYAPAGLTRGVLSNVSELYSQLDRSEKDKLYSARVNALCNFPEIGTAIWGQKTLQARQSALSSVNVRRLLIKVKKFVASSTKYLVFEPNTASTRNRFLNIVEPYLERVKQEQGLYRFRVVMDETNNTDDLIDQNILYGQLYLQPTRTAEFIKLDFNIQPTGAAFPG